MNRAMIRALRNISPRNERIGIRLDERAVEQRAGFSMSTYDYLIALAVYSPQRVIESMQISNRRDFYRMRLVMRARKSVLDPFHTVR